MGIEEINGASLSSDQKELPAFPCGIIAKTFFNGIL